MTIQEISLLLQGSTAGAVIAVVIIFLKSLDKQNTQFMAFIKEQREANNKTVLDLAEKIEKMDNCLGQRMSAVELALKLHQYRDKSKDQQTK
jgi:hypothetical protein